MWVTLAFCLHLFVKVTLCGGGRRFRWKENTRTGEENGKSTTRTRTCRTVFNGKSFFQERAVIDSTNQRSLAQRRLQSTREWKNCCCCCCFLDNEKAKEKKVIRGCGHSAVAGEERKKKKSLLLQQQQHCYFAIRELPKEKVLKFECCCCCCISSQLHQLLLNRATPRIGVCLWFRWWWWW